MAKKNNPQPNRDSSFLRKASYNTGSNKGVLSKSDFKYLAKKGLGVAESDNQYHLMNSNSSAVGKYQFLWKTWGKDIAEFAKKDSEFQSFLASSEWKKNPKLAFSKNPRLQEKFMDYHLDNEYKKTLDLYKKDGIRNGIRMDEVYAMIHHQGHGTAKDNLSKNIVNYKSLDGTSGDKYFRRYNNGVYQALGMPKDSKGKYLGNAAQRNEAIMNFVSNPNSKSIQNPTEIKFKTSSFYNEYSNYKNEMKNISDQVNKGLISQEEAAQLETNVMRNYDKKGLTQQINKRIEQDNQTLRDRKYSEATEYANISNIINKGNFSVVPKKNTNGQDINVLNSKHGGFRIRYDSLNDAQKQLLKDNPDIFDSSNKNGNVYIKDYKKFNNYVKSRQDKFFGKNNSFDIFRFGKNGDVILSEKIKLQEKPDRFNEGMSDGKRKILGDWKNVTSVLKGPSYSASSINNGIKSINPDLFLTDDGYPTEDFNPDLSYDGSFGNSDYSNNNPSSSSTESIPNTSEELVSYMKERDKKEQEKAEQDLNDSYLNAANEAMADTVSTMKSPFTYEQDDYKNEIPVTSLIQGLAGVVVGMDMQDQKDPLRNDRVSGAFQSYASQMAEIANRGMSIQDEAAALNKITEAYSGGVAQLVKASGGHRNTVLGNLGRLDAQKQMSLSEIAVADADMKLKGLQAYGESMRYISEHDNDVERTNNEREYNLTQRRRLNGEDLTQAAWGNLMDTLSNYENNKPGSAKHIAEAYYLNEMLGYNPNQKDKFGPGSLNYMLQQKADADKKLAEENGMIQRLGSLDSDTSNLVGQLVTKGTNIGKRDIASFVDYIRANPELDLDKLKGGSVVDFYANNVKNNNQIDPSLYKTANEALEASQSLTAESPTQDNPQPLITNTNTNLAENLSSDITLNLLNSINKLNNNA